MAKRYGHIGDESLRQAMAVLDRGGSAALTPVEEIASVADRESMTSNLQPFG
jgi:hypothetical protein